MRLLYINNFRGFIKTLIPIHQVNFLVGENSTGKTSILKLIKIISDETFKFSFDFFSQQIDLGRFEDIVNKSESSGNFFEIGMMYSEIKGGSELNEDARAGFVHLTYEDINEKITLSKIRYRDPQIEFSVDIGKSIYRYRVNSVAVQTFETPYELTDIFFQWCTEPTVIKGRKGKIPIERSRYFGLNGRFTMMRIIDQIYEKYGIKVAPKKATPYFHSFFEIMENFIPKIRWIAPIRAEPKRIYEHMETKESVDGSHAPQVLRDILSGSNAKVATEFKHFLDSFGKNSRMFDEIKVKKFGVEKFAPFEIQIILEGKAFSISNVGYGVSQVLPLLLEVFNKKTTWMAIQQPEVHLHPRAQAEFGELLYNSAAETEKYFFIETHSDFTIDRFRQCIRSKNSEIEAQVLYFSRKNKLNSIEIIPISSDGAYSELCSSEFRDFFINESINLLGI